jgi:hypothetical protein
MAKKTQRKHHKYTASRELPGGIVEYDEPSATGIRKVRVKSKQHQAAATRAPAQDETLNNVNFNGEPFDAATFASLGKVVGMSSNRKVVRDRFGSLWGIKDGHLIHLSFDHENGLE